MPALFVVRRWGIVLLLVFTGGVVALYTYGMFGPAMRLGFDWSGEQYEVVWVHPAMPLKVGDKLIALGGVKIEEYANQLRQPLFSEVQTGQTLTLTVAREGVLTSLNYTPPGPTPEELLVRLLSQWWLAWLFWGVGVLTYFSLRPKDTRWYLLIAFFCLTAIWLGASILSRYHLWESAIVLRMALWLSVPVYWHLHWIFPERLPILRAWPGGRYAGYALALGLAVLEWLELLPQWLYGLGFLLAVLGIVVPLIMRGRAHATQILWRTLLVVIAPSLLLAIWAMLGFPVTNALVALLGLPFLPLGYFYTAYRPQLGWLELRTNRLIALGLFGLALSLLATLGGSIFAARQASLEIEVLGAGLGLGIVVSGLVAAVSFPAFQSWVERRLLKIPSAPRHLLGRFLTRITTSLDRPTLVRVLTEDILPSVQITQSALLTFGDGQPNVWLYTQNVPNAAVPNETELTGLFADVGRYRPPRLVEAQSFHWVRVALLLNLDSGPLGLWLLGRRDPDDVYAQTQIDYLQVLATQIALTLKVLTQTEQLRQFYQTDIDRRETEQARLARDLHDLVLNNLARVRQSIGAEPPPGFMQAYTIAVDSLRQTISDLRPPLLDYGLYEALKALANDHEYRPEDLPPLRFEVPASAERYDLKIEEQAYRIIQQAYENAVQHAQAKTLRLGGVLTPARIELNFEDDGVGFNYDGSGLRPEANVDHHFGLLMMRERAALIGAELTLRSQPGRGTQVKVVWGTPAGG